jgi:hypothetical protein
MGWNDLGSLAVGIWLGAQGADVPVVEDAFVFFGYARLMYLPISTNAPPGRR